MRCGALQPGEILGAISAHHDKERRYGAPAPERRVQRTHGYEGAQSVGLWCSSLRGGITIDWPPLFRRH